MKKKTCVWKLSHNHKPKEWWKEDWATSCDYYIQHEYHHYKIVKTYLFCPKCGKPLEVQP